MAHQRYTYTWTLHEQNGTITPDIGGHAQDKLVWSSRYLTMFLLSYHYMFSYWFGKNKKPILRALALATVIGTGVREIEDFVFVVENHYVFFLAISVFTAEKGTNAKTIYSAHKAIKRWAHVQDRRRVKRNWAFEIREKERDVWATTIAEATTFVRSTPLITW
eukprot:CAMPEP_0168510030 /NCGR_PEP_ID=MMETSP0405-20121227/1180_1 /TAXON_ID=498012 /ORGANISM="Trichosphaerium sp, Strain Am-I-7 wt" /LENGTH=162 /DNA_ID=CAMNT_0008527705 /DNA_START=858 /DNA_END=1343 /DNA_ORIENTATION=-